ncbi:MAG: response regulator transcription factor [Candidatus Riflebacteria bacterium]|nr:response regulator transcription factor [Candidatus Riflebacteria bacterium]
MKPQSPETTRIFLVEDHPVMRLGLKMMLQERGFIVCGEAASESEAMALLPGAQADIAIFDLSLNGETAFAMMAAMRHLLPDVGMIVYSMHDSSLFVENALKIGVNAYVTKADPVETLVDAIFVVLEGKQYLGPTLIKSLEERITQQGGSELSLKQLSEREMEVLTLLARGFGPGEIAQQLSVSSRTVETYFSRLREKLGLNNNRELIREAIRVTYTG